MSALGRHIIAELYGCKRDKLNDVSLVETSMLEAADKAGATVINSTFHHFAPFGVSGVVVIQESHFSIHCWPEYRYASVDIYTCGDSVNPWVAYEFLKVSLNAEHGSTMELSRGQSNLIGPREELPDFKSSEHGLKKTMALRERNVWFTQRNADLALSLRHQGNRLFQHYSEYQKIEVYDTAALGKILVLDGKIVCAEADEYVYHEMITHVPLFVHPNPERVLVIGGGDGGTIRELLKHETIKSIDIVEIDKQVIDASKQHLPRLSCAFSNHKVHLTIGDGAAFVEQCTGETYDIVIVDSDAPEGPGEGLYSLRFYECLQKILKSNGILVTQSQSPRYNQTVFRKVFSQCKAIFGSENVHCFIVYLPSFPSGMWSFSFSTKGGLDPIPKKNKQHIDEFCHDHNLQYYSYDVHRASFVLPQFVQNALQ
jgi:spermidine synthase